MTNAYQNIIEELEGPICFSGGSKGADTVFTYCAGLIGHSAINFSFLNHSTPCPKDTIIILNQHELSIADPKLEEANKLLRRKYPTRYEYVNNLLRRNYYQIIYSDKIFAVTPIEKNGLPAGGTGWTIVLGVLSGIQEVYVFDCKQQSWFEKLEGKWQWKPIETPPVPDGKYTGIGSHELPEMGKDAILKLYGV